MSSSVLNQKVNYDSLSATGAAIGGGGLTVASAITGYSLNAASGEIDLNVSNGIVAPSTAAPSASLKLVNTGGGGTAGTPVTTLQINQANPNLAVSGNAFQAYATTSASAPVPGNSYAVARPGVASAPLNAVGYGVTPALTGGADAIAVAGMTATSIVRACIVGGSAAFFATAGGVVNPAIAITATGFTITGTIGGIYAYQVYFA